ncbi:polysaccharide deacetylase family protein [Pedobacter sp. P351]|uniref:polysaccharide deacetylase family protein n=1 Tax=Pedobacter superstes TaxID=3133441 RepID=UPI00309EBEAD
MYSIDSFTGADLPEGTLCLTFDDGPGEHTYAIGKYLAEQGIEATFFVVGKYAIEHPEILQSIKDFGHLIANHTFEHPDMPYYRSVNGDVQDQILRTDTVIKRYISGDVTYFRSPYGKWSSEVASDLNSNLMATLNHIGPIRWDMGGIDCYYWQLDRSVEDALAEYHKEIKDKKKGIVLFHDDIADMDFVKPRNKTLQLLQLLVPALKSEGYRFVGLGEIESIKRASETRLLINLKTSKQRYVSIRAVEGQDIFQSSERNILAEFSMKVISHGKVAIQSSSGAYLCVQPEDANLVLANKKTIENDCLFDLIPLNRNRFMLRAGSGNYLNFDREGRLAACAAYMRKSEIFTYLPINLPSQNSLSLAEQFSLLKKRALFIKSKLLQA